MTGLCSSWYASWTPEYSSPYYGASPIPVSIPLTAPARRTRHGNIWNPRPTGHPHLTFPRLCLRATSSDRLHLGLSLATVPWPLSLAVFLICWSLAGVERTGCRTAFGGNKPGGSAVNLAAGDASRNLSTGQPFISYNPPHKGAKPMVR